MINHRIKSSNSKTPIGKIPTNMHSLYSLNDYELTEKLNKKIQLEKTEVMESK